MQLSFFLEWKDDSTKQYAQISKTAEPSSGDDDKKKLWQLSLGHVFANSWAMWIWEPARKIKRKVAMRDVHVLHVHSKCRNVEKKIFEYRSSSFSAKSEDQFGFSAEAGRSNPALADMLRSSC